MLLLAALALQTTPSLVLVPVDDRPATGQFAAEIAQIAGQAATLPPKPDLGHFTQPGSPAKLLAWLESRPLPPGSTVIASTDMIAYGGLIASRDPGEAEGTALIRLDRLLALRRTHPGIKILLFDSLMRVRPTYTRENRKWRAALTNYEVAESRAQATGDPKAQAYADTEKKRIPKAALASYDQTRKRNFDVTSALLDRVKRGEIDYLMLGQDDAQEFGPHLAERAELEAKAKKLGIQSQVYFGEGIDQASDLLLSRAMLQAANWQPKVQVVYSDESRKNVHAAYEIEALAQSIDDQIFASGARPAGDDPPDYTLYVNVPDPAPAAKKAFIQQIVSALKQQAELPATSSCASPEGPPPGSQAGMVRIRPKGDGGSAAVDPNAVGGRGRFRGGTVSSAQPTSSVRSYSLAAAADPSHARQARVADDAVGGRRMSATQQPLTPTCASQPKSGLADEVAPLGVADVDLAPNGSADADLFNGLWQSGQMMNLLCYSAWNTAGNTLGTAVAEANACLLGRKSAANPVQTERAQSSFLLHRFVNDYAYHKFIRPQAYGLISDEEVPPDELDPDHMEAVNRWVRQEVQRYLNLYFKDQLDGRTIEIEGKSYRFDSLTNILVKLPWPRAYEVEIDFDLKLQPVNKAAS